MAFKKIPLPGAHQVIKRHADQSVTLYVYRCRGGERIGLYNARNERDVYRLAIDDLVGLAGRHKAKPEVSIADTISGLIRAYRQNPQGLQKLGASTRKEWERNLTIIERELGSMPLRLLKAKNATSKLIEWRDSYSETPRKADYLFQVLKRVFEFGVERRYIDENPITGVKNIYVCDRSDVVVEEHELQAILQVAPYRARLAIRLAAATGLRRGDLVNLRWEQVYSDRIVINTRKSRGKTHMVMPLKGDAFYVISELREERDRFIKKGVFPSPFVLTTAKGEQWKPDSVTQAFIRAAQKVGIEKRLHDLRGTAATRYVSAGVPEVDIALFMGWEPKHVTAIMQHYVNKSAVGDAAINRIEQNKLMG